VDVAEVDVVVEPNSFMTSKIPEITFITDHYFFLNISPPTKVETKSIRRKDLEQKAKRAILKFSKHDTQSSTNFLEEDQDEMSTWIRLVITECIKIKK
jgi:hypothetical protein